MHLSRSHAALLALDKPVSVYELVYKMLFKQETERMESKSKAQSEVNLTCDQLSFVPFRLEDEKKKTPDCRIR